MCDIDCSETSHDTFLAKLISASRAAKATQQPCDFYIECHVLYKMALGNGGATLLYTVH